MLEWAMGEEAVEGVVSLIPGEASAEAGHALTGMLKRGSCSRWGNAKQTSDSPQERRGEIPNQRVEGAENCALSLIQISDPG